MLRGTVLEHSVANDVGLRRYPKMSQKTAEALSVGFGITSICFGLLESGVMPPGAALAFGMGFGIISVCLGLLCLGSSLWAPRIV